VPYIGKSDIIPPMEKHTLLACATEFLQNSPANYISPTVAISEAAMGMRIFDDPVLVYGRADDPLFKDLKLPGVVGGHFVLPAEWLPQAKTVISIFLPFSETVKHGNQQDFAWPSPEWLHGRIEGQACIRQLCDHLQAELTHSGYESIAPSLTSKFWSQAEAGSNPSHSDTAFTSNWSERHVAYVCGHGTFGLSKGLITSKGVCGRFSSIITNAACESDQRAYHEIYSNCTRCGACMRNCPAGAITLEKGKDHTLCSRFLDATEARFKPRYGCGKCQVGVPCESGIPSTICL